MCDKVISGATLVRAGRPGAERSYCGVCALQGRVTDPDSLSPSHEPGLLGVTDPGGSEPRTRAARSHGPVGSSHGPGQLVSESRTRAARVTDPGGSTNPSRSSVSELASAAAAAAVTARPH